MIIDHWRDVEGWHWSNFSPREMAERSEGWERGNTPILIVPEFMDRLQAVRNACGFPLSVTSGYRSPEYNAQVSRSGPGGVHTTGRAVDIQIFGAPALRLVEYALRYGFTGIGVNQSGHHLGRFIHLDDVQDARRPALWSY